MALPWNLRCPSLVPKGLSRVPYCPTSQRCSSCLTEPPIFERLLMTRRSISRLRLGISWWVRHKTSDFELRY